MKHTPGPWIAVLDTTDNHGRYAVMVAGQQAAITGWGNVRQTEADARLIAAAPALLAACKAWVAWAEQPVKEFDDGSIELPSVAAVMARTRAALALAEEAE